MRALSNDVARRLFYKRVFSHEKECPHELVQVSEDILKKCGGIPLAIITVASLLASNCQIKTKYQWYGLLNSIGRGLTEDPDVEEMKKILLFSYYDLPSHLKPCLLYLSIFPEDHKIVRDELIWRWIAEGFDCSETQETTIYELGECYYNELINRNMVQAVDIDEDGRAAACRVHDMVLDIICSLSSEENFVTILDGTKRKLPNPQSKVRRLSIHKSNTDVATTNIAQARSVTVFGNDSVHQMPLVSSSKGLRVLALEDCTISGIGHMDNLLHLRYLGLRGTRVEEFQVDIGKLHFLQTLDLRGTKNIRELPSSIVWLRNLMCLYIDGGMKLPSGIASLTSLEVLEVLDFDDDDLHMVKELSHLIKLKVLVIECHCRRLDESMGKTLAKSLSNLHRLESLCINACGRINFLQEGWVPPPQLRQLEFYEFDVVFKTLPSFINPTLLPLLSCLMIRVSELRPEDIQLLGMLPTLRHLHFRGAITNSLSMDGAFSSAAKAFLTSDAFPCATKLSFARIPVMPSAFPRGAAPRLKHLQFSYQAKWISRDDMDFGMGHLPSLQTVEVGLYHIGSRDSEVKEVEAALRAAVSEHPNRADLLIL